MSDHDSNRRSRPVAGPAYVDHVVRKERFLAAHPGATITTNPEASPYERWRGCVPGYGEAVSWDLGNLLDKLEEMADQKPSSSLSSMAITTGVAGRNASIPVKLEGHS
jgi:hypothetical protein